VGIELETLFKREVYYQEPTRWSTTLYPLRKKGFLAEPPILKLNSENLNYNFFRPSLIFLVDDRLQKRVEGSLIAKCKKNKILMF